MYALGANAPKSIFDARATCRCVPGSSGPRDAALAVLQSDPAVVLLGDKRGGRRKIATIEFRLLRPWVPELRPGSATRIGRQAACVHRDNRLPGGDRQGTQAIRAISGSDLQGLCGRKIGEAGKERQGRF